MADFINTLEILGDDNVVDSIINRTITEFKDNNVKILGNNAFNGCAALEIVDLPEFESNNVQVERIFANCSSLKTVNLPKLKYVYTAAFEGCTSLTAIELPATMETIANGAFRNAGLKSVKTGDGLAKSSAEAFASSRLAKTRGPTAE